MSKLKDYAMPTDFTKTEAQITIVNHLRDFLDKNNLEYCEELNTGYYIADLVIKDPKIVLEI